MTRSPWAVLLEGCAGAAEAVIVAPYIKVEPLAMVLGQLQTGASVTCFSRWTPRDISTGASDIDCRTLVVKRGGSFWLNNRLHAKYYRFGEQVLVGSANMTGLGLSYPHHGNLEILCEPGPTVVPSVFETSLKRGSREVSDDEFRIWQQCPVAKGRAAPATQHVAEGDLGVWRPRTRNPSYLWFHYSGDEALIISDEQRDLASLDVGALEVPRDLTEESFRDWIRLCLEASPFVESVRQIGGRTDASVWDLVAEEWGVSRAIAARWVSTAHNWLRYFDPCARFWRQSTQGDGGVEA